AGATTATSPSESGAVSTDATASGGSPAGPVTAESASTGSGTASGDASTDAYFSEDESDASEPGAGD
ncbi:MAG: P-type conjugative transfer protein TrbL, partial [Actinomycetota bacterium]|nr:P-type conjugative transfer protein TrbL [Actinomycetota bacterium]